MYKHRDGDVQCTGGSRNKQQRIHNNNHTYGNKIAQKDDNNIRIGFQNFAGLSGKENDIIDDTLKEWIDSKSFDIFGIPEVNLYWPRVHKTLQFHERITRWWRPGTSRSVFSYNKNEERKTRSVKQYGGTAQICRHNTAIREYERGCDDRGLGRWVWQKFRGKGSNLIVITAYRPADGQNGPFSVNTQHRDYFRSIEKDWEPRKKMLQDLEIKIEEWKMEGLHVIVMMDCNEDIRSSTMKQFQINTGLQEAILQQHGDNAPNTHTKGTKPIDTILISPQIEIASSGYCDFDEGVQGTRVDHRCIWIDINFQSIFGTLPANLTKFEGRRVKSNDPRIVKTFNERMREHIIRNKLDRDINYIFQHVQYPCSKQMAQLMEKAATKRYEAITYADKRARKLRLGNVPFSEKYKIAVNKVILWRLIVDRKKGRKIRSHTLKKIIKKTKIQQRLSELQALTLEESLRKMKESIQQYRRIKLTAQSERQQWMNELASTRVREMQAETKRRKSLKRKGGKKKKHQIATIVKTIISNERMRDIFRRVQYAVGKQRLRGITAVEAQSHQGGWEQITDHDKISIALAKEYKQKYHQTENTPPMQQPMLSQLGYLGLDHQTKEILEGRYRRQVGNDQYSSLLLSKLQQIDNIPIQPGITREEYQNGWKKAKEKTSSGGIILHFGHCKSMAQNDGLAQLEAMFLSSAMKSGYAYASWRKGVDCTLQKKANSLRIDKLRTIVLFEADFNFVNKFISRKIAKKAEANHECFADEQYGSRKDRRAIDQALNKRLCFDILRLTRRAGAVAITDLKSCYDRVCHSIASMSLRRIGLTESESQCMFEPLQYLEHRIRCAFGDSRDTYGSDRRERPMQGLYQGNGAGPVIWAAVSSPILQILRDRGFGTKFVSSLSNQRTQIVGFAFVDDTDLIQTATANEGIREVHEELQKSVDHWEGLIKATGGALSVDKCKWWAIDFEWTPGGAWKQTTTAPLELTAIDHRGHRNPVQQLATNQAFETLGVLLAPNGCDKESVQALTMHASKWSEKLNQSFLQSVETSQAVTSTIMKKLEYPLAALTLSEKECDKIMSPIIRNALPRTHYNRQFCRRTLFAPGSHLGLEFPNLYAIQITSHLEALLRHGPHNSITGKLIRESIEHCKVELGLPGSLFVQDYEKNGHYLTDCWIKNVWKEAKENSISISETTPNICTNRENDRLIMDILTKAHYTKSQIRQFNRCRIFARVHTISDIATGDGRFLIPDIILGNNPMMELHKAKQLKWPQQAEPSLRVRKGWLFALRTQLTSRRDALRQPLGRWIRIPDRNHPRFDPTTQSIYIKNGEHWRQYQKAPSIVGRPAPTFQYIDRKAPPSHATMAVAWNKGGFIQHTGFRRLVDVPYDFTPYETIIQKIQNAPPWTFKTKPVLTFATIQKIRNAIRNNSAIAVTDGSYKNDNGTAAMCILSPSVWQSTSSTPGPEQIVTPYRCELAGILSVLNLVEIIDSVMDLTGGSITIACDNVSAGQTSLESEYLANPTQDHFDILQEIFRIRHNVKCRVYYRYVEGHQKERYGTDLDRWAILNDRMDALAKAVIGEWQNDIQLISPKEWSVSISNKKVCTQFKKNICRHINAQRVEHKWTHPTKRNGITREPTLTSDAVRQIDFQSIQIAWDQLNRNERRFVGKLSSRQLPVGKYMHALGYWKINRCPMCLQVPEEHLHFLSCSYPPAVEQREDMIRSLQSKLRVIHTEPTIASFLVSFWKSSFSSTPWNHTTIDPAIFDDFKMIGNNAILYGRYPSSLTHLQNRYYKDQDIRGSWSKKFLPFYWRTLQTIWFFRNRTFHSSLIAMKHLLGITDLDRQIREIWFAHQDEPQQSNHQLLNIPLHILLKRSPTYKLKWIRIVTS